MECWVLIIAMGPPAIQADTEKDLRVNSPFELDDETGRVIDALADGTCVDPGRDECSIPISFFPDGSINRLGRMDGPAGE